MRVPAVVRPTLFARAVDLAAAGAAITAAVGHVAALSALAAERAAALAVARVARAVHHRLVRRVRGRSAALPPASRGWCDA